MLILVQINEELFSVCYGCQILHNMYVYKYV